MRIGQGIDVHRLEPGRKLIMGGVEIPHDKGLLGHSDADVLVHAVMDAILGALALGDIGKHFPDTDQQYAGADSMKLLSHVVKLMREKGYRIGNLDATVVAQKPKIAPYIPKMKEYISSVLGCTTQEVSIKATTTEKLGFEGRQEGITAFAVVLLENN